MKLSTELLLNLPKSAFLPYGQRYDFIYSIIKPGYAKIRKSADTSNYSHQ
jgi:hypothetical protein